jgi:hypothetical protein
MPPQLFLLTENASNMKNPHGTLWPTLKWRVTMGRIWLSGCVALAIVCTHYSSGVAQPTLTPKQIEQNADLGLLSSFLHSNHFIIVGELLDVPVKEENALLWQDPRKVQVSVYSCRIKVLETLHGSEPSKEMKVYITRWPDKAAPNPSGVSKGEKCIFVLNHLYGGPESTHKITVDPWLGVLPYNGKLAELLRKHGNRPSGT